MFNECSLPAHETPHEDPPSLWTVPGRCGRLQFITVEVVSQPNSLPQRILKTQFVQSPKAFELAMPANPAGQWKDADEYHENKLINHPNIFSKMLKSSETPTQCSGQKRHMNATRSITSHHFGCKIQATKASSD